MTKQELDKKVAYVDQMAVPPKIKDQINNLLEQKKRLMEQNKELVRNLAHYKSLQHRQSMAIVDKDTELQNL